MMMNQNFNNGTANPWMPGLANYPMGVNPAMQGAPQKMTTGLTKQEIDEMMRTGNGAFQLAVTKQDLQNAKCAHRTPDSLALHPTGNTEPGKETEVECSICHQVFNMVDQMSTDEVQELVNKVHDVMETTKAIWVMMPPNVIVEYFQIEALLKKLPQLWTIAKSQMVQNVEAMYPNARAAGTGYISGLNVLNNIQANPAMMQYGAPNPYMGQPNPMMYNQQMAPNPYMGQVQQPMYNPAMQYAQQNPGMYGQQAMPNQMAQQMTAGATGLTNGFGMTEAPTMVNPVQPNATTGNNGEKPVVTKSIQA